MRIGIPREAFARTGGGGIEPITPSVALAVGAAEGSPVGSAEGNAVGAFVGKADGEALGNRVGNGVGAMQYVAEPGGTDLERPGEQASIQSWSWSEIDWPDEWWYVWVVPMP